MDGCTSHWTDMIGTSIKQGKCNSCWYGGQYNIYHFQQTMGIIICHVMTFSMDRSSRGQPDAVGALKIQSDDGVNVGADDWFSTYVGMVMW